MSRSYWAWTESCAIVGPVDRGAGTLDGPEVQRILGLEGLFSTASSFTRLRWLAVAVVLLLACGPAAALSRASMGANSRVPVTQGGRGAEQAPTVVSSARANSGPFRTPGRAENDAAFGGVLLGPGAGEHSRGGSGAVRALQRRLAALGFTPGPVDGRFGPRTERAVLRFQAEHGLPGDGIAGSETLAALAAPLVAIYPGAGYQLGGSGPVRSLQRRLAGLGFAPGAIDGRYGPLTEHAVKRFQAAHGLRVNGIADAETLARVSTLVRPQQRPVSEPQALRASPRRVRLSRPPANAPVSSTTPEGAAPHAAGSTGMSSLALLLLAGALVLGLAVMLTMRGVRRGRGVGGSRELRRAQAGAGADAVLADSLVDVDPATPPTEATARQPEVISHADLVVGQAEPAGSRQAEAVAAEVKMVSAAAETLMAAAEALTVTTDKAAIEKDAPTNEKDTPSTDKDTPTVREDMPSMQVEIPAIQADTLIPDVRTPVSQDGPPVEPAGVPVGSHLATEQSDADGAFNLGVLLERQGDTAGALAAYRRADECGHGPAACNLGVLLEEQHDTAGALAAYRRARQRGDANGSFNLGVLLEGQGDMAGALGAYRRADECGHGPAACNLGVLLEGQGDATGAMTAYRRAAQRGDANGAFNLGALLEERGDVVGAVAAYDRARQHEAAQVEEPARASLDDASQLAASGNGGDDRRA